LVDAYRQRWWGKFLSGFLGDADGTKNGNAKHYNRP